MSEFESKVTSNVAQESDTVEAFDDFEVNASEIDGSEEGFDVDFATTEQAVVDAIEAAENVAKQAAEATDFSDNDDDADDAEEAVDEADDDTEEAEEADDTDDADEADDVNDADDDAEEADVDAEEAEEADEVADDVTTEEADEAEEAADEADEAEEAADEADDDADDAENSGETDDITTEIDEVIEAAREAAETEQAYESNTESDDDQEIDIMGGLEFDGYTDEELAFDADDAPETEEDEEADEEFDIMSSVESLENEEADEEAEASEGESDSTNGDEAQVISGEVEEDDYLDYDDTPAPKKLVSGKTAVITMVTTCVVTICLIAGAFWFGTAVKRDMGISLVSYTDRFNACDTENFTMGSMFNVELVSMSDKDYTFSAEDISALKKGNAVGKFNDLVNIQAKTRFGKIVSMDITFDSKLDKLPNPSASYMLILGNALSGLFDDVKTGDNAFIKAYNVLVTGAQPAVGKGTEVYVFKSDDFSIYADYSTMAKTQNHSDVSIHIESANPDYIDAKKLDFSWIPFDFSSDKPAQNTASDTQPVSSEVSPTDE